MTIPKSDLDETGIGGTPIPNEQCSDIEVGVVEHLKTIHPGVDFRVVETITPMLVKCHAIEFKKDDRGWLFCTYSKEKGFGWYDD